MLTTICHHKVASRHKDWNRPILFLCYMHYRRSPQSTSNPIYHLETICILYNCVKTKPFFDGCHQTCDYGPVHAWNCEWHQNVSDVNHKHVMRNIGYANTSMRGREGERWCVCVRDIRSKYPIKGQCCKMRCVKELIQCLCERWYLLDVEGGHEHL